MPQSATERPVILIVEDEFLIRMHAAEMIKQAGYDVVEAINESSPKDDYNTRADNHRAKHEREGYREELAPDEAAALLGAEDTVQPLHCRPDEVRACPGDADEAKG